MYVSKAKGERAMSYIADYPLYASTCGITYEQAVKVTKAMLGAGWERVLDEFDRIDKLSSEELKAEMEADRKLEAQYENRP